MIAKNVYHSNTVYLQTCAKDVCFIEDDEQFHTMLNFYHDLGLIVKHRSTVILKAQWLISLFKKLITIPAFEKVVGKDNLLCIEMIADRGQDLLPSPNLPLTKKMLIKLTVGSFVFSRFLHPLQHFEFSP